MKTGIHGAPYTRKWGDEYYLKLKSFGFDCNDFNMSNTNSFIYEFDDKQFDEYFTNEKKLADKAGISISQVHGPWRWPPADATAEDRTERLQKMAYSIHASKILGAKFWVVHPIMPFGTEDLKSEKAAETRMQNVEFMKRLLEIAKKEDITICLENMPFCDFSLSSPSSIAEIVNEINDPHFAMCLDTGHANNSSKFESPAEAIRKFGQFVKVLHVHDNLGKGDLHLAPFHGTIDWKDFSSTLREINFDGVLSLECDPPETLPEDIYEEMFFIYAKIARAIANNT